MRRPLLLIAGTCILALLNACGAPAWKQAIINGDAAEISGYLKKNSFLTDTDNTHSILTWPLKTPLMVASEEGKIEILNLLLDKGADPNLKTWPDCTALSWAAIKYQREAALLLIKRGANLDQAKLGLANLQKKNTGWGLEESANLGLKFLEKLENKQESESLASVASKKASQQSFSTLAPTFQNPPDDNAVAIVIGIQKYQSLPVADFVNSDAGMMRDYLKAMGYQDRNIEFLSDERATYSSIRKAVETWLPKRINPQSRVTVYYAGHGAPDPQSGDAYIVPYDGDPSYLNDTGYPLKRLYEKLELLQAKQVVVFIDACFSGAGGRGVLASGARALVRIEKSFPKGDRIAVLTSTQGAQISTSSSEKKQGIFTYFLLKAFQEGNRDLVAVYDYLKSKVENEAKRMNVEQTPSLSPDAENIRGKFNLW